MNEGNAAIDAKLRALVVESDPVQRSLLSQALTDLGCDTTSCDSGLAGKTAFFEREPDVLVVDLHLEDLPGWELIELVRDVAATPIIICAAKSSVDDLHRAVDLRADGFLEKPVSRNDLAERVRAITKRMQARNASRWLYQSNGFKVDLRSCEVLVDGEEVELTGTEFRLLKYLVEHRGWVLSHDQILSQVWGPEYQGEKDRVKLYVWYLRRKIEHDPCDPKLIVTKRGLGYTFAG